MDGEIRHSFIEDEKFIVFEDGRIYKLLNPPVSPCGYKFVRIGAKSYPLHRIVAETFIPNPENKPQVNHIDCNKTNNAVSNLEWVTASENVRHALKHGLRKAKESAIKRATPLAKNLKKYRTAANMTQRDIAHALGIDPSAVSLWEAGKVSPTVRHLRRLADILGCQPADLL